MHSPKSQEPLTEYGDIFDIRGQLYHQAMQTCPDTRSEEFLSVVGEADISPGMTVVDVPSGGAYLSRYLDGVELIGLETSHAFATVARERAQRVLLYEKNRFPLRPSSIDRILSIAGLHHVRAKQELFTEAHRVLKPTGRLVVADVAEGSAVRRFLDEFVGQYCDTGHSGWYFGDDTRAELRGAGFSIIGDKRLEYVWHGADRRELAEFCRTLFGMVLTDTATVVDGIGDYLGFREMGDRVGMNWQLHCFSCEPDTPADQAQ
jgi:SAM-dependent methyltransferase